MESILIIGALAACLYFMIVIGRKGTPKNNRQDGALLSESQLSAPVRSENPDAPPPPKPVMNKRFEPESESMNLSIEQVVAGGFICLKNVGDDQEDFEGRVMARHEYHQSEYSWQELECDTERGPIFITVERDDELEVTVTTKKFKMRELGLTREALEHLEESEEGSIEYAGVTFTLEEFDEARFFPEGDESRVVTFTFWDFYNAERDRVLSIEDWGDKDFEVSYGATVKPHQVEVLSLSSSGTDE